MNEGMPLPCTLVAVDADAGSSLGERFDAFLREERTALLKFLRTRLPTEEDAQDAAQDSMTRMVRYRDTEPAGAWKRLLYRIAVNVAYDQLRYARSHHATVHISYEDALDTVPAETPTLDEQLGQRQALAEVTEVILGLPPRSREIFLLNRVQGMTYMQVADTCGISLKAVEKHMTKALAALHKRLGKPGLSASWEAGP